MADNLLTSGPHHREQEFVFDPTQRRWLTGTCGPCALAMAAWNASGKETHTLDVYRLMRAHGMCDANGASTPGALWHAAHELLGLTISEYHGYVSDDWPGWRDFLSRHAGRDVVVLELSQGQALRDEVSGLGENAVGLRYHYICGYGPSGDGNGWMFADGDNYARGDVLQRYSYATLAQARPCAALAIRSSGGDAMWTFESNGTGKDGKGHTCGKGMAAYIEQRGLTVVDGLMSETYYAPDKSFLPLDTGEIVTWDGTRVAEEGAQVLVSVWQQLVAARQSQAPANDPLAQKALDVLTGLKAMLGEL